MSLSPTSQHSSQISFTAGPNHLQRIHADIILPAAISLLPNFHSDFRRLKNRGGRVLLVDAFVKHQHPVWRFNNAVTLTLWGLPPSRQDTLQPQVAPC